MRAAGTTHPPNLAELNEPLAELRELLKESNMEPEAAAQKVVDSLDGHLLGVAAYGYFVSLARASLRSDTLVVERASSSEGPEDRDYKKKVVALRKEHNERIVSTISDFLRDYASRLEVRWTNELLNANFALPNGKLVTWGNATLLQHSDRLLMFSQQASNAVEGGARHLAAIQKIQSVSNATTLNEALCKAAS